MEGVFPLRDKEGTLNDNLTSSLLPFFQLNHHPFFQPYLFTIFPPEFNCKCGAVRALFNIKSSRRLSIMHERVEIPRLPVSLQFTGGVNISRCKCDSQADRRGKIRCLRPVEEEANGPQRPIPNGQIKTSPIDRIHHNVGGMCVKNERSRESDSNFSNGLEKKKRPNARERDLQTKDSGLF